MHVHGELNRLLKTYLVIVWRTVALLHRRVAFVLNSNGTIAIHDQPTAIAIDKLNGFADADAAQIAIACSQRSQIIRSLFKPITIRVDKLHGALQFDMTAAVRQRNHTAQMIVAIRLAASIAIGHLRSLRCAVRFTATLQRHQLRFGAVQRTLIVVGRQLFACFAWAAVRRRMHLQRYMGHRCAALVRSHRRLSHDVENTGIANNDRYARHHKRHDKEKFFRRCVCKCEKYDVSLIEW